MVVVYFGVLITSSTKGFSSMEFYFFKPRFPSSESLLIVQTLKKNTLPLYGISLKIWAIESKCHYFFISKVNVMIENEISLSFIRRRFGL